MMTLANQQPAVAKNEAGDDVDRAFVYRFHRALEPKRVYDENEIVGAPAGNRTPNPDPKKVAAIVINCCEIMRAWF